MPELSSLEPLEFDEASQRLVARGEARLDIEGVQVQADRITYYQEYALADAMGNVSVMQGGWRLLADRMSYDAKEKVFSLDLLRAGRWPFHVSGVFAGGSAEDVLVQDATIYYGDPGPLALNVSAEEVRYVKGEYDKVEARGATFRVGKTPFLYLPSYTYYPNEAPYYLDLGAGYDGELGAYLQSASLFPVFSWLRGGANLDYYTERGLLAGPTSQYVYHSETQRIVGALSTGYINDLGNASARGIDFVQQPIDSSRGFAEWRHKHQIGERFTATAVGSHWSDSEVTRDFREDYYYDNQSPESFAEAAYAGDNSIVSVFGRFRVNDFQVVQERLPEIRFDLLPAPISGTGAYHRASVSYVQLREDFGLNVPALKVASKSNRLDLAYRVERPMHLQPWLTFTPLAGVRLTNYSNQQADPLIFRQAAFVDDEFTRKIYELGFDLTMRGYHSYDTTNQTWDVDGLRHIVRPVLRYRYFSDPGRLNEIAPIDRETLDLERPVIDLIDLRNIDDISEAHLARFGLENLFQTRAEGYGSRTLATLNFYQDVLFERDARYDGSDEELLNASWIELLVAPAPWLKFELATRFRTETLTLEELRTRTRIISGEIWELGLATDFLNKRIDQYRIDFIYRINERYAVLTDMRIDANTGEFTRFHLGMRSRVGSTWEVLYAITFREEARRESGVEFSVKLRLTDPNF